MFRQFIKSSYRQFHHKIRISPTTLSAIGLGVSATVLFAVAGRNAKIIHCDAGSSLDDDELEERGGDGVFKRPKWKDEEYLSTDQILSSGPTWFPPRKSGIVRCDALIVNACVDIQLFFIPINCNSL